MNHFMFKALEAAAAHYGVALDHDFEANATYFIDKKAQLRKLAVTRHEIENGVWLALFMLRLNEFIWERSAP